MYHSNISLKGNTFNFYKTVCDSSPPVKEGLSRFQIVVNEEKVFEHIETIQAILQRLISERHFGSFSLFIKEEQLPDFQKEYQSLTYRQFPFEMNCKAKVWTGNWIEFKFKPLFYLFSSVKNSAFQELIAKKNLEQTERINVKQHSLNLDRSPVALRNLFYSDLINLFFEHQQLDTEFTPSEIALLKKFFSEIKLITYEELMEDIESLTKQLKNNLQDRPFGLIFRNGKSSQWIAELALPLLEKVPQNYLYYCLDTEHNESALNQMDPDVMDYVIFDDFAYSGSQIYTGVMKAPLRFQMPKGSTLHIVIPYVSEIAKDSWDLFYELSEKNEADDEGKKVKILHSGKTFDCLDTLMENSKKDFLKNVYPKFTQFVNREFHYELPTTVNSYKTLAFTEWKMPDSQSTDQTLLCKLGKKISVPIYKTQGIDSSGDLSEIIDQLLVLYS